MSKQQITKQDAEAAVESAGTLLFEAAVLRQTAELIREHVQDSEDVQTQIAVLQEVAGEKASEAFGAIDFVNDYFLQQPKKRTKKKLEIAKAA
jgi:hypothetical protein